MDFRPDDATKIRMQRNVDIAVNQNVDQQHDEERNVLQSHKVLIFNLLSLRSEVVANGVGIH